VYAVPEAGSSRRGLVELFQRLWEPDNTEQCLVLMLHKYEAGMQPSMHSPPSLHTLQRSHMQRFLKRLSNARRTPTATATATATAPAPAAQATAAAEKLQQVHRSGQRCSSWNTNDTSNRGAPGKRAHTS
jgi:hypothetical protein